MMTDRKALTLSIIIPVYNEEAHIGACLDSIASQTLKPDEVIVVDNNSTDASVRIAKSYSFVKVVKESAQGYIPARNRGFEAAKGDILGRIDADSQIATDWVQRVKSNFSNYPDLAGLTGYGLNNDKIINSNPAISRLFSRIYFWNTKGYLGVDVVWGSNMAIRAKWWQRIKSDVCLDWRKVHEDQDLSLLIAARGGEIKVDPKLFISFDGAKLQNWETLREYMRRRKATKKYHKRQGTFASTKIRRIPFLKRLIYIVLTTPASVIFHIAAFLYSKRAKEHIKQANRQ